MVDESYFKEMRARKHFYELKLSAPARNVLIKMKCRDENDIVNYSRQSLMKTPGCGPGIVDEIEKMLESLGMFLAEHEPTSERLTELYKIRQKLRDQALALRVKLGEIEKEISKTRQELKRQEQSR